MKTMSPVLLLGDTLGTASTGLLYLASYLRRNGIEAYCQWNDNSDTLPLLKENIKTLLERIQPQVVGISMKWFPHMARVFAMAEIIKEYAPGTTVVVGGNTASFYPEYFVKHKCIDCVVRGDGEKPLLDICRGEEQLTNCLYEKHAEVISTPFTYVHNQGNTADIYLSHLDDIFVSGQDIARVKRFYINTGKGCSQQCFYCAGGIHTQKQSFNRQKPFIRGIKEVQRDLETAKALTPGFMFDFELPMYDEYDSFEYYKTIWGGIDLSQHECEFYSWMVPPLEFIQLAAASFKYVLLSIDMCSLSEPHRLKLASMGLVKPQPTDQEIFTFLDGCEPYDHVDARITPILGLPYFTGQDINRGSAFISYILSHYSPVDISWGRLHAQPGALLSKTASQYDMHSYAAEYRDFLHFSQLNLEMPRYPDLENINYPYIYFNDNNLNMKISQYYFEINHMIRQHRESGKNKAKKKKPLLAADIQFDRGNFEF